MQIFQCHTLPLDGLILHAFENVIFLNKQKIHCLKQTLMENCVHIA
jgi:hypothetical protein